MLNMNERTDMWDPAFIITLNMLQYITTLMSLQFGKRIQLWVRDVLTSRYVYLKSDPLEKTILERNKVQFESVYQTS